MRDAASTYRSAAARRAALISIMLRRVRPGSGSVLSVLRAAERPMKPPDLGVFLPGVRYVVVGGMATSLYMPTRTTVDLNILVAAAEASLVEQALRRAGAVYVGDLSIGGTSWRLPDGTPLDVLVSDERWVTDALAHPNLDQHGLPIIGLPYLVLLKLRASRGVDIGDLTRMLGAADEPALARVREVIGQYEAEALEDLESLVQIGRLERGSGDTG